MDILEQYDNETLMDLFQYGVSTDGLEYIGEFDMSYDEGNVTTTYVARHTESGRFFATEITTNSWCDYYDDFNRENIYEVEPKEVTVTKYVPLNSNS